MENQQSEETEIVRAPLTPQEKQRQAMRQSVRFFYDLQKSRIQNGNRSTSNTVVLDKAMVVHGEKRSEMLLQLEKNELKIIGKLLKTHKISEWLLSQRGIGPTMAGVIVAEVDISRANTPSSLWKYCGLHTHADGKAARPVKGQKHDYNAFLRTKLVGVAADCMIKANSPWRKFYDDYKHRKMSAGWGKSDGHRHRAAIRYMMKMFLLELYKQWRVLEGLPVPDKTYAEAYLGVAHGQHAGTVQQP